MDLVRCSVCFSGRVQGVGFRFTAYQAAQRHAVHGWAKNLSNGTVECLLEGSRVAVDQYLEDLQQTVSEHTMGRIDDMQVRYQAISAPEFSKFEIIY